MTNNVDVNDDSYLSGVTINELLDRIEHFRNIDIRNISDRELFNEIENLFKISKDGEYFTCHHFDNSCIRLPKGTTFYRVRTIPESIGMTTEQDFWNNPEANEHRLNEKGQQVLYACVGNNAIYTAINETKIQPEVHFAIISYRANSEISLTEIGKYYSANEHYWSDLERQKRRIIRDFLKTEFTRDVGYGTEYQYRLSRQIAKQKYSFCDNKHMRLYSDGVIYPSVKTKEHNNVCLYIENARKKLDLLGAAICTINSREVESGFFGVKLYAKRTLGITALLEPTIELNNEILECYKNSSTQKHDATNYHTKQLNVINITCNTTEK